MTQPANYFPVPPPLAAIWSLFSAVSPFPAARSTRSNFAR